MKCSHVSVLILTCIVVCGVAGCDEFRQVKKPPIQQTSQERLLEARKQVKVAERELDMQEVASKPDYETEFMIGFYSKEKYMKSIEKEDDYTLLEETLLRSELWRKAHPTIVVRQQVLENYRTSDHGALYRCRVLLHVDSPVPVSE